MPVTRERKEGLVETYRGWLEGSSGLILASYSGMSVRGLEDLRRKVRDAGGEFHVVKNRLMALALREAGVELPAQALEGTTAIGFASDDIPAVAKAIVDAARQSEALVLKIGVVDGRVVERVQVERLAELPPLPVLRAQLLGVIRAPAGRVAGALAGSVRQVVNVVKAYSETQPAGA
ncbi:MAG TPA: 50S ribosomal protein L10 [Anaerolineales bacterium]|nr:50S ribosomal protein L10 [Anaerolineales bacterium]